MFYPSTVLRTAGPTHGSFRASGLKLFQPCRCLALGLDNRQQAGARLHLHEYSAIASRQVHDCTCTASDTPIHFGRATILDYTFCIQAEHGLRRS